MAQGRFGGKGKGDQRLCRFGRGLVYQRGRDQQTVGEADKKRKTSGRGRRTKDYERQQQ